MSTSDEVGVRLTFKDRAKFSRDATQTAREIEGIGRSGVKTNEQLSVTGAALGFLVARVGLGILRFGKTSVAAFNEAEQSQTRLQDAFAKFPALNDVNISSLRALNTARARTTRFDDDETAAAQATIAQFQLTGSQIREITPLMQDYAAKTKTDLVGGAENVGRALLGNARALKTIGVNYVATGDRTRDYTEIVRLLRLQVGGFAEKEGKDGEGRLKILSNRYGELKERVGKQLLPVMLGLSVVGLVVLGWMERNQAVSTTLVVVLGGLAAIVIGVTLAYRAWALTAGAVTAVHTLLSGAVVAETGARSGGLIALVLSIVKYAALGVVIVANTALTLASAAAVGIAALVTGDLTAAQWALNIAMDANPVGLLIIGMAALVGVGYLVYRNFDSLKRLFGGFWDRLVSGFKTAINYIIRAWNGMHLGGFNVGPYHVGEVRVPQIPELAEGGIVRHTPGGTIVRVGEGAYDEQITPLRRDYRPGGGGAMPVWNGAAGASGRAPVQLIMEAGAVVVWESGDTRKTMSAVREGVETVIARG